MSSAVETLYSPQDFLCDEEKLNSLEEYLEYKKASLVEIVEQISECVYAWNYENNANDEDSYMKLHESIAALKDEKELIEKQINRISSEICYQNNMIRKLKTC